MTLLRQVIMLLTESPGNLVYHLVTLFALQAVFAMMLAQWRRNKADEVAYRFAWAAGGIWLARLGLLAVGLAQDQAQTVAIVLPPLEQSVHVLTAVLLVWALLPPFNRWPRLADTLLILMLLLELVMTLFFVQEWQWLALSGLAYSQTPQAQIWQITAGLVLVGGLGMVLLNGRYRATLRPSLLFLLLVAHNLTLFASQFIPTDTQIPYWLRLSDLLVFPLWGVLAYRHTLLAILTQSGIANMAGPTWQALRQVIASLRPSTTVQETLQLLKQHVPAPFTGVAVLPSGEREFLNLTSEVNGKPHQWNLSLAQWPAFRMALETGQMVELRPGGLGARQLFQFYQELGVVVQGSLFVQPLRVEEEWVGLLLLVKAHWADNEKQALEWMSPFIAQALANAHRYAQAERAPHNAALIDAETRFQNIMAEQNKLKTELIKTQENLRLAETAVAQARQQAQKASDEASKKGDDGRLVALQAELTTLRQALTETSQLPAALVTNQDNPSFEWFIRSLTRYSRDLELAETRLSQLEEAMQTRQGGAVYEVIASLAQELRTPMTSIAGYTDLLLGDAIGELNGRQREFLQRVKANVERTETLLGQLGQYLRVDWSPTATEIPQTAVAEVVELAVQKLIPQIRDKELILDLQMGDNLPTLPIPEDTLEQILMNLLTNACLSTPQEGRIGVEVQVQTWADGRQDAIAPYLIFKIHDSGPTIAAADWGRVFQPQHRADTPLISGLGDTAAGLAITRRLTENYGGRIWLDHKNQIGNTFWLLFPLNPAMVQTALLASATPTP